MRPSSLFSVSDPASCHTPSSRESAVSAESAGSPSGASAFSRMVRPLPSIMSAYSADRMNFAPPAAASRVIALSVARLASRSLPELVCRQAMRRASATDHRSLGLGGLHRRALRYPGVPFLQRGTTLAPALVRKPEIEVAQHARSGDLPDAEPAPPVAALFLQRVDTAPDLAELARFPVAPLQRFGPHRILVAQQHRGFEHAVGERLQPQRAPSLGTGLGKERRFAVQAVEVLADHGRVVKRALLRRERGYLHQRVFPRQLRMRLNGAHCDADFLDAPLEARFAGDDA